MQQVKLFQKSQFPLRFYVVNFNSRRMYIFDKPGGKLKQDLALNGVLCVVELQRLNNEVDAELLSPKTKKEMSCLP